MASQRHYTTLSSSDSLKHEVRDNVNVGNEEQRKSVWYTHIAGLWETQQMVKENNRDLEIQVTLRELILYVFFLIILLIVAIGMMSSAMYYFTTVMSDLFLETEFTDGNRTATFLTSACLNDFWTFAESVMVDGFTRDFWYKHMDSAAAALPDDMEPMFENKILGLPRLRQVRVTNQSCVVQNYFRNTFSKCYGFFSESVEDREPLGKQSGTAWRYSSEEELEGSSHDGELTTYSGGGYVQDLPQDREQALEVLRYLKTKLWLDRGTRAIFLDFTVYNANINLFCVIKLLMEISPTGGVIPSYSLRTVKLIRYVSIGDHFVLACEIMFLAYLLFYTCEEVREMVYFKFEYFKSFWNVIDFVIIVIGYACLGLSLYRSITIKETLRQLLAKKDNPIFEDFSPLGYWQVTYNNAVSVLVFFAWLKIFKYITFSHTMNQLNSTLLRCMKDIAGFVVIFLVLFGAFAQVGYMLFGAQEAAFRTLTMSVFTLLRTLLGDFDYPAMEESNRMLAPVFFMSYIIFVFFVLMNMFLAIIADAYSEVKNEVSVTREEMQVFDFLSRGVRNVFRRYLPEPKPETDYDRIKKILRKRKFTDLEIAMFFSKYDVEKDKMIGESKTEIVLDQGDADTAATVVSRHRFTRLSSQVRRMETSIDDIATKVNFFVDKLGT